MPGIYSSRQSFLGGDLRSSVNRENGFTGLEAAIVLIAFVSVAAVFSYAMLGAGFFTTQKAQHVVYSNVQQAGSLLQSEGNVYGETKPGDSCISRVIFSVKLASGGTPVDFDKVVIVYSNATQLITLNRGSRLDPDPGVNSWSVAQVQNEAGSPNDLLDPNEEFQIICNIDPGICPRNEFSLEIRQAAGAAFTIHRTAPSGLHQYDILY